MSSPFFLQEHKDMWKETYLRKNGDEDSSERQLKPSESLQK